MYVREVGPKDYNQTFKQWMDEHAELREMIAEGRSKLEWERKIPDDKLVELKSMLDCAEFKEKLPKVSEGAFNFKELCGVSEFKQGQDRQKHTCLIQSHINVHYYL